MANVICDVCGKELPIMGVKQNKESETVRVGFCGFCETMARKMCNHLNRVFYLIECAAQGEERASWWTGLYFSDDVNAAARFPERTHAETALTRLDVDETIDRARLSVTGHKWLN